MSLTEKLLAPLDTPQLMLRNRVVMAPMSRRRAVNATPALSAPLYYGQRAGAGLIIAENSAVAANGVGYLHAPGIYNEVQLAAWKQVVDEVHDRNGKIFVQLVHTGRIGHPLNNEGQAALVAPSVVRAREIIRTPEGHLPMPEPEALSTAGARALVDAHIQAAVNAVAIGFDGVEIHGAHGFLPEQFLHPLTNRRTDHYGGGSIESRSRFLLEIMEGVAAAIGKERTGVRLSPFAVLNDLPAYAEEKATHLYLTDALQELGILYIHLSGQFVNGRSSLSKAYIREVRGRFQNLLILAGAYTVTSAEAALQEGLADLIAFGRPFISNPDLVERFRHNVPLTPPDAVTFYEGGDKGYIDYPAIYSRPMPCSV